MNAQERYDKFVLPDDVDKVTVVKDTKIENAVAITVEREGESWVLAFSFNTNVIIINIINNNNIVVVALSSSNFNADRHHPSFFCVSLSSPPPSAVSFVSSS